MRGGLLLRQVSRGDVQVSVNLMPNQFHQYLGLGII